MHLEHPFAGGRILHDLLNQDGYEIGRKHLIGSVCVVSRNRYVRRRTATLVAKGETPILI